MKDWASLLQKILIDGRDDERHPDVPPFCNYAWWIRAFETDRDAERTFLSLWLTEAKALLAPKRFARARGQTHWWGATELLVVWCDAHPSIRVDPAPFQDFMGAVWDTFSLTRRERPKKIPREALHAMQRLQFANELWRQRIAESLNVAEKKIKAYIDEHPGCSTKRIADAVGLEPNTVNKYLEGGRKLHMMGYRQPEAGQGEGYFPPGSRI